MIKMRVRYSSRNPASKGPLAVRPKEENISSIDMAEEELFGNGVKPPGFNLVRLKPLISS